MSQPKDLSPGEALARVFNIVIEEANANPAFARRLLAELGASVKFAGTDAAIAADPVLVAAKNDYSAFREMFQSFSEADLKKMVTNFGLGTAEDIKSIKVKPKKIGFIDILWTGACHRIGKPANQQ